MYEKRNTIKNIYEKRNAITFLVMTICLTVIIVAAIICFS